MSHSWNLKRDDLQPNVRTGLLGHQAYILVGPIFSGGLEYRRQHAHTSHIVKQIVLIKQSPYIHIVKQILLFILAFD